MSNCIYCGGELVKIPDHPTWRACITNCDKNLATSPASGNRGTPRVPGPWK